MAHLAYIFIFPIKSLDGVAVREATVLESGAFKGDREFAMVDSQNNWVNGKLNPDVHRLRSAFDVIERTVSLRVEGQTESATFHLDGDRSLLENWLSEYFGFPVRLVQDTETGFPDDTASPGPTIVSTATLQAVADWLPDQTLEESRHRFRTNLEVADTEPFWEDGLFSEADSTVLFQVGDVQFEGVNPCQRCIVPTRNAFTGDPYPGFQKIFTAKRKETLPSWVNASRFNHFYRLAVNTRISQFNKHQMLKVGDSVSPAIMNKQTAERRYTS